MPKIIKLKIPSTAFQEIKANEKQNTENTREKNEEKPKIKLKLKLSSLSEQNKAQKPITKRKVYFRKAMEEAWSQLSKRDEYGLFMDPVDTKLIPDYLNVIKTPMDFSTMKDKMTKKLYEHFDQFKEDFLLICQNSMKYNAPGTIYYKNAQKLMQYGIKYLDKMEIIYKDEEPPEAQVEEETPISAATLQQNPSLLPYYQQDQLFEEPKQKRKYNRRAPYKVRSAYLSDCSRLARNDSEYYRLMLPPVHFPFINREVNKSARPNYFHESETLMTRQNAHLMPIPRHYLDYGPFHAMPLLDKKLGQPLPIQKTISNPDYQFAFNLFGDLKGRAYIESQIKFLRESQPPAKIKNRIRNHLLNLTEGSLFVYYQIIQKLKKKMTCLGEFESDLEWLFEDFDQKQHDGFDLNLFLERLKQKNDWKVLKPQLEAFPFDPSDLDLIKETKAKQKTADMQSDKSIDEMITENMNIIKQGKSNTNHLQHFQKNLQILTREMPRNDFTLQSPLPVSPLLQQTFSPVFSMPFPNILKK